jgi:membrane protein implicated in regulation of membrane protease activity
MAWWAWFLLGLALVLLELATPGGFYFIFFGAGAFLVGIFAALGITDADWVEWLLFSVFAVGAIAVFRPLLLRRFGPARGDVPVDSLIGETATAMERIPPNDIGKVELRGSAWSACNIGEHGLSRGERCRVERVEGLTLYVREAQPSARAN